MKFLNLIVLAVAGTAMAQDASTTDSKKDGKSMSTKAMCNKMFRIEGLEKLAGNTTLLEMKTKNNSTKIDAIKAKATKEAAELKTLQGNATLVAECAKIKATRKEERQCAHMHRLERLEKIAGNATLLASVTKGNTTKADDLKKKATDRKAALTTLQGNGTLTAFCAGVKDKQTCRHMKSLTKEVEHSKNQTFLDNRFKSNATKIDAFKKKAAKAQEMLTKLQANSTLMDICKKQTTGGNRGSPASAATSVQAFGVSASIMALFTAGMLML